MDAESLREAAREVDAVVGVTLMHGERTEEAERTLAGHCGRGRARRSAGHGADVRRQQRGVVMGDTPEGVDLAE
jgi:hypothetical protein